MEKDDQFNNNPRTGRACVVCPSWLLRRIQWCSCLNGQIVMTISHIQVLRRKLTHGTRFCYLQIYISLTGLRFYSAVKLSEMRHHTVKQNDTDKNGGRRFPQNVGVPSTNHVETHPLKQTLLHFFIRTARFKTDSALCLRTVFTYSVSHINSDYSTDDFSNRSSVLCEVRTLVSRKYILIFGDWRMEKKSSG